MYSFPMVVSAQDCSACDTTPNGLQTYIDMVDALVDVFPKGSVVSSLTGSVSFAGEIQKSALRQEAVFTYILLPKNNYDVYAGLRTIYKSDSMRRDRKLLQITQQKIIDATFALVNSGKSTEVMPESVLETINTELKKLGYIQLKKNGTTYELGVDNAPYETLAKLLRQFQMLYESFHAEGWYHDKLYSVGQGILRSDEPNVEDAIKENEREHLSRVATSIWNQVKESFSQATTDIANSNDLMQYIEFPLFMSPLVAYVWQIQQEYACSVGVSRNMCNTAWQKVREDTSFTFKERIAKDRSHSKNTFLSAWSRLKGVFKRSTTEDGKASRQREESLLNSYWGKEVPNKSAWRDITSTQKSVDPAPIRPAALRKNVTSTWKSMSNSMGNTGRAWKKLISGTDSSLNPSSGIDPTPLPKNPEDAKRHETIEDKVAVLTQEEITKEVLLFDQEVVRFFGNNTKDASTDLQQKSMQDSFFAVLHTQENIQVASVFNDVNRTTKKFPLLSAAVYNNIDLLGKKNPVNTSEGGWYYAMSKVCELQCSNLEGKVCQNLAN